jgi:acetyl esterase
VSIEVEDIETFRRDARQQAASWPRILPDLPVGTDERVALPAGAPVAELHLYRPAGGAGVPGVFVNLHGGGFVMGDWESDDPYCRLLADTAGCAVVNLDYVLAPEHKFPAAVEQTHAVLVWLAEHGSLVGVDGARLAVGGHSAGGNLSAAACLLAKERGGPPLRGQIIDYAPLDLATAPGEKSLGTVELPPEIADLDMEVGARFNAWYLPAPEDAGNPLASPALAADLTGLPPALVITAEQDLLRAEGDRYAGRLAAAGVETEHVVFEGSFHAFTHFGPEMQAVDAWHRMAAFLSRVLA